MRLTSSDICRVSAGELTRWIVTPAGPSRSSAVPPSENERFHLDSVAAGRRGWLALELEVPGDPGPAAIGAAVEQILARHDILRGHFVPTDDGFGRRLSDRLRVRMQVDEGMPRHRSTAEFTRVLMSRIDTACDPFTAGGHFFGAIRRTSSTTIICGFDHCYVDARSLAVLAAEFIELIDGATPGPADSGLRVLGELIGAGTGVEDTDPRLRGWGAFLAETGWSIPEFPLDLGLRPGQRAPTHTQVATLLPAAATTELSRYVHRHGGRTYPAVLTCTGVAIRTLGGPLRLPTVIPTGAPAGTDCVAWLVGNAPLVVHCDGTDLLTAVRRNARAMTAAVPCAEIGLGPVYREFGCRMRAGRHDVFMMSYVDYTRLPVPARGIGVEQISAEKPTDAAQWWFWRDDDGIHVRARHPRTPQAVATVGAVIETSTALLRELADTGPTRVTG